MLGSGKLWANKAAYAASKAGVTSLGESLRAEYASGPIKVTVVEPGHIESEMTGKSDSTMLMVDNDTGARHMVNAIECESGRTGLAVDSVGGLAEGAAAAVHHAVRLASPAVPLAGPLLRLAAQRVRLCRWPDLCFAWRLSESGRAAPGSGAPVRRSSCRSARPVSRRW
ncbi:hypothetical protein MSAR_07810 [Mycolicibacterium sarraceniae]|uniref:Short-chain dehydrogenase/reductase n=1 Tax=Mycolicibacterium sarraceniae TaxID=1534348 RepID=A0A7I7SNN9_9MYCO|nr:hypothetical protein MSAR_07810 [Mycolicibacterium sarraceniae]